MADEVVHQVITIHRSELIPGGQGARIGYSDDHPGHVFLVVPEAHPDYGVPHCPCGCAKQWSDKHHRWRCPHCDGPENNGTANSVEKEPT